MHYKVEVMREFQRLSKPDWVTSNYMLGWILMDWKSHASSGFFQVYQ